MSAVPLDLRMLAYALSDKRILLAMATTVRGEHFNPEFRPLWELVSRCFAKYKDIPTANMLEHVAGLAWEQLGEIYPQVMEAIPRIDRREYPVDLEKLRERANDNLLRRMGRHVYQKNWNGHGFDNLQEANKALRETVAKLDQLYKTESYREGSLAGTAPEAWAKYQRTKRDPASAAGIHLGFAEFDRITNGIREGELLLIGGESGTGKSALSMNMAVNAWLGANKVPSDPDAEPAGFAPGKAVVYFSIEMPYEALERRLHACIAGVPLYGIRDGTLDPAEEARYRAALKFIQRYPHQFHIVDIPRGATMRYIEAKHMELCHDNPDDPIRLEIVDYLNLMSMDGEEEAGPDWLKIGKLGEQAHEFTRVHGTPMISPVQLNRPPKEEAARSSRPDQDRIARSLMLVQNANMVLNIEKRKDEHLTKDMRVHIVKMRDGEQGLFTLQKRLDAMRLFDDPTDWTPGSYEPRS